MTNYGILNTSTLFLYLLFLLVVMLLGNVKLDAAVEADVFFVALVPSYGIED